MNLINGQYLLLEKIGLGRYGTIYKAQNIETKEFVVIKLETIMNNLRLIKNESYIYNFLSGLEGIPTMKCYGKDNKNYYLVLNLLGKSLQNLIEENSKISIILTLKIGIKILNIIKLVHEKGFIHRNINPNNLLLGINNKLNNIYLIDYSLGKSYLDKNNCHIEIKRTSKITENYNYKSVISHKCIEMSRRDDFESFCYVLLYLCNGFLPWNNINDEKEIIYLKYNIINETKYNYPLVLIDLLKYVRSMEFEEKPNYYLIIDNFKREIESLSI